MFTQDYLKLRLIRLKATEEWPIESGRFAFLFPKGGGGQYVSGPVVHRLAPGDVLVVNATGAGKLCVPGGGELIFWSFSVCLENLFPLFAGNEISGLQRVAEDFKGAKLYAAAQPLAVECQRLLLDVPPQVDLGHRSQLLRIAAAILSVEFNQMHRQRVGFVRAEEHLLQVFENLPAADLLNLPVDELATKFGCSRRHLNRLFHQYFGQAIASLRMEMRLLKAVSLLRDADAKIINVAEECGFNHLGLFNTCFKRRFGVSPGQWRKSGGQTEPRAPSSNGNRSLCPLRDKGLCPWVGDSRDPDTGAAPKMLSKGPKGALKNPDRREPAPRAEQLSAPDATPEKPLDRYTQRVFAHP